MTYIDIVPPDTLRQCPTCKTKTIWGFVPAIGHSRCRKCGCNLHRGTYRALKPEDLDPNPEPKYYPVISVDDKTKEIHRLRCENGQLRKQIIEDKTKMKEQAKHLNALYIKLRGKTI
jgi:hypothetical protein